LIFLSNVKNIMPFIKYLNINSLTWEEFVKRHEGLEYS
jgi:hypothetical protein